MSDALKRQIGSLDYQIDNYDSDRYTCTLTELTLRRARLQGELSSRIRQERKKASKDAKNRLRYRGLRDCNGDRTHSDGGVPLYNEWGDPNF